MFLICAKTSDNIILCYIYQAACNVLLFNLSIHRWLLSIYLLFSFCFLLFLNENYLYLIQCEVCGDIRWFIINLVFCIDVFTFLPFVPQRELLRFEFSFKN